MSWNITLHIPMNSVVPRGGLPMDTWYPRAMPCHAAVGASGIEISGLDIVMHTGSSQFSCYLCTEGAYPASFPVLVSQGKGQSLPRLTHAVKVGLETHTHAGLLDLCDLCNARDAYDAKRVAEAVDKAQQAEIDKAEIGKAAALAGSQQQELDDQYIRKAIWYLNDYLENRKGAGPELTDDRGVEDGELTDEQIGQMLDVAEKPGEEMGRGNF